LSIDPNNAWTLNRKGLTLYNLGNYTGAIDVYDRALSIDPNNAEVQANKRLALDALKNQSSDHQGITFGQTGLQPLFENKDISADFIIG
jgi:tetratricopeptide (TPR) repeat protein